MRLHRVLPWVKGARAGTTGHPLFVPPVQGAGRLDNPEHYLVLYASDAPAGAVAEAFGNLAEWSDGLFEGRPSIPGSATVLATYELEGAEVLDLDDAAALQARGLKPSDVVTRDRTVTQRWALDVFREGRWAGARWWSYHDPRWGSFGVWAVERLRVVDVEPLSRDHPAVREAGSVLLRLWR
ncbi:MAG TPA: RES domain-containing protein [Actinomycetota bacterium]